MSALASDIVPVSNLEQALLDAKTPKESFDVEAKSKAGMAYHKEQRDYEQAFLYAITYIKARCYTTELIEPTIKHGGDHTSSDWKQGDGTVTLLDYGFDKKQWNRRKKELKAYKSIFDIYQDDCIQKWVLPTPFGLVGFFGGTRNANNSGQDEWYTPSEIIEKARRVMGGIDLDPASSDIANETVKADKYYTIEDDGLAWDWEGRVFMNPPYSQPTIKHFTEKLTDDFRLGFIDQAIVLVNNATETGWFQYMLAECKAVCFVSGRLKFIDENGNPSGAPLQGQAILYFGEAEDKFFNEFSDIGTVLWNGAG